jgi:hypothetical protein
MDRAAEYLARAEELQKVADSTTDGQLAEEWKLLAEEWRALAEMESNPTSLDWPARP